MAEATQPSAPMAETLTLGVTKTQLALMVARAHGRQMETAQTWREISCTGNFPDAAAWLAVRDRYSRQGKAFARLLAALAGER